MGPPAALTARVDAAHGLTVEQAVFTSIRSPLGMGYRLVAVSPGVTDEEKREIVQCAPSHQSLADETPGVVACVSFPLGSGRRCVFLSQNAGVEYSGRGGCRVHTHVLVLTTDEYRQFGCDPLAVATAAVRVIDPESLRKPPTALRALTLSPTARSAEPYPPADDRLLGLVAAVLAGRRLLATGLPAARDALRLVLSALPAAHRARLSLSCGLRPAPSRAFQLVIGEADSPRLMETLVEMGVELWSPDAVSATRSPFDVWLRHVGRQWHAGQAAELNRLASGLTAEETPELLGRVADLADDLATVDTADEAKLGSLAARWSGPVSSSPGARQLHTEFTAACEARRAALAAAREAAAAAEAGSPEPSTVDRELDGES